MVDSDIVYCIRKDGIVLFFGRDKTKLEHIAEKIGGKVEIL